MNKDSTIKVDLQDTSIDFARSILKLISAHYEGNDKQFNSEATNIMIDVAMQLNEFGIAGKINELLIENNVIIPLKVNGE
jgi:hypothetical protein